MLPSSSKQSIIGQCKSCNALYQWSGSARGETRFALARCRCGKRLARARHRPNDAREMRGVPEFVRAGRAA